jgi:AcrR family transcriptional regulator
MSARLTPKGAATRRRLVEGTALLTRDQGVAETSLDQILQATAMSKSQLFHYFPDGRGSLLLAVAGYEAEQVLEAQRPFLDDLSSLESWKAWRDAVVDHYARLGERCPLGGLTSELGNSSSDARRIVSELYDQWEGALINGVQALLVDGLVPADLPVRDTARAILTTIQGGAVMLRATGRLSYLETALDAVLRPIFSASDTALASRLRVSTPDAPVGRAALDQAGTLGPQTNLRARACTSPAMSERLVPASPVGQIPKPWPSGRPVRVSASAWARSSGACCSGCSGGRRSSG